MTEPEMAARLAQETEERKRAEDALRFVAEVSTTLAESLDYEATMARVVRLAVPFLADWCTIDVLDERGVMRRVGAGHRDPAVGEILREVRERQKEWASARATAEMLKSGKTLIFPEMTDEILERYVQDPEVRALVKKLGIRSGIGVPMLARGRSIGGMTFSSNTPGRIYGAHEVALAEELARRAAVAIDNARLYRDAQEAVRLRDEFLTVASHELKAPLTPLTMLVDELDREVHSAPPDALARTIQILRRQTHRLSRLVDELLDVTEIQAGLLQLRLTQVDLVGVVKDVRELLADDLARARTQLALEAPAQLTGRWDRGRLQQVVTNLLSNAIKFGGREPIDVTVEEGPGGVARLVVQDHGIGISPDRLPGIFDRFERGVSAKSYGGLGLGLYVVHEIVTAFEGTVRAESTPGSGSTFTVELPRGRADFARPTGTPGAAT